LDDFALVCDTLKHFGTYVVCPVRRDSNFVGVEDDNTTCTFDVKRPTALSTAAFVGHHGVCLSLAVARQFQIAKRVFQQGQIGRHLLQSSLLRCRRSLAALDSLTAFLQRFARAGEFPLLRLCFVFQVAYAVQFGAQFSRRFC
jgi:hypothetical protein